MNELIKITESNGKKAVSARELHYFLESKQDFSNWIKDRIDKYDFIEGIDYERILLDFRGNKIIDTDIQQVHKIEYAITLDMAKELSMVEGNERGKQARKYFIEKEKIALGLQLKEPSKKELALMVIESETARELAESKVIELQPKADVYESIASAENLLTLNDAEKILGIGRNKFTEYLRSEKILFETNVPYQHFITEGYFKVKVHPIKKGKIIEDYAQTFVTGKGLTYFSKRLNSIA